MVPCAFNLSQLSHSSASHLTIVQEAGRLNMAFVMLNRFLDLCDAMDDPESTAAAIENADFVDTDIPFDFHIPQVGGGIRGRKAAGSARKGGGGKAAAGEGGDRVCVCRGMAGLSDMACKLCRHQHQWLE